MTNRDRLSELKTADFWKEINKLMEHQAEDYIDYVEYLDSEDSDINHFIRNQGECLVLPSETEKISAKLSGAAELQGKKALFLRERRMYDSPYAVVFMDDKIYSVPLKNIIKIKND